MEKQVSFENGTEVLRGILHLPDDDRRCGTGIVLLHGWSGCRLGPHRMFVKTARRLTEEGCCCLRFDFRGRGESEGNTGEASIASMISDARHAIDFLVQEVALEKVLLLGICSGGKVAIGAAADDPRIDGLALWSAEPMGELRSSTIKRRKSFFALRDYLKKMTSLHTWRKILSLNVNVGMVRKAMFEHEGPDAEEIKQESVMLDRFRSYSGRVLFVYGSNDPETRQAAEAYSRFCGKEGMENEFHEIKGSNHSFYSFEWEKEVMGLTEEWVGTQSAKC